MKIRDIKFRIPHLKNGVFQYFTYWGTIDHKGQPSLDHGCFSSPSSSGLEKGWHQQYTGLKDRNGKEIYEGDIVECIDYPTQVENTTGEVYFAQGAFRVKDTTLLLFEYGTTWTGVVGNIFESPELC